MSFTEKLVNAFFGLSMFSPELLAFQLGCAFRIWVARQSEPHQNSDPHPPSKPARGIIRLRTVVIHENRVIPSIAENSAAQFSDRSRRFHPTRSLCVESPKHLQLSIFLFRQDLHAHGSGNINSVIFRLVFFPRIQRFTVVTKTSSVF